MTSLHVPYPHKRHGLGLLLEFVNQHPIQTQIWHLIQGRMNGPCCCIFANHFYSWFLTLPAENRWKHEDVAPRGNDMTIDDIENGHVRMWALLSFLVRAYAQALLSSLKTLKVFFLKKLDETVSQQINRVLQIHKEQSNEILKETNAKHSCSPRADTSRCTRVEIRPSVVSWKSATLATEVNNSFIHQTSNNWSTKIIIDLCGFAGDPWYKDRCGVYDSTSQAVSTKQDTDPP